MWSQIVSLFLVSLVCASGLHSPAWNKDAKYVYKIEARSLVSLDEITSDYSGVFLRAKLHLSPRSDGHLDARISHPEYAQIHHELEESWDQELPESLLHYQEIPLSQQPFQIELKHGAIRNVIVSKKISNWEANIIKSFVSQFQLDTQASNLIDSSINILPTRDSEIGVFKTMEETVTGVSETLYDIHPLPKYLLENKPDFILDKQQSHQVLEVVKTKNFTNSVQIPLYHFGLDGLENYEGDNQLGELLSRSSITVGLLTGNLEDFTIQNLNTVEEYYLSPTFTDKQKGALHTLVNVTLVEIMEQTQQNDNNVVDAVEVGLVYGYSDVFAEKITPRPLKPYDHSGAPASAEADSSSSESDEHRHKRSVRTFKGRNQLPAGSSESVSSGSSEEDWQQRKPHVNEAPQAPLLPFFVGYEGQSIKKQQNIVEIVQKLAQKLSHDYQNRRQEYVQQNILGKFVILTSLVRVMDQSEIQQVASHLYSQDSEGPEALTWVAFRDAVAQAGTGPALLNIQDWILNDKIDSDEAAELVATAARSARQPTLQYMETWFKMVQNPKVLEQEALNTSSILAFTQLVNDVYSNLNSSHNKFPVHSFGSFRSQKMREFVVKSVLPYLSQKLHSAIVEGDTEEIHTYIRALGNTGHPQILEAFESYLEGKQQASQLQRVLMVLSLDKLVENHAKIVRSVAYRIYQNPSEDEKLRVAAVFQLMKANPSAAMLQRMAAYTYQDSSKYVSAAVKSGIESAAKIEGEEFQDLRQAAVAAKPLLTTEEFGAQYSQQLLRGFVYEHFAPSKTYKQDILWLGGKDQAFPRGVSQDLSIRFGGFKQQIFLVQSMLTSVEDLFAVFRKQTRAYQQERDAKKHSNPEQHPFTSEYVAKMLNMQSTEREQLEGYLYLQLQSLQKIFSFDNNTLNNLTEVVRELEQELKQGKSFQYDKMLLSKEIAIAVPTVLGFPFIFTYDIPTIVQLEAEVKGRAEPQISDGEYLQKPENVVLDVKLTSVISSRIQSQFSILTPFDHKRYSAGYNKNVQFHVPLTGKVNVDIKQKQVKMEVVNPAAQQDIQLGHYSNVPYTSKGDLYNVEPEQKIIRSKNPMKVHKVFGEKSTGIAFELELTADKPLDFTFVFNKMHHRNLLSYVFGPWSEANVQFIDIKFGISASKSSTKKILLDLGYLRKFLPNQESSHNPAQRAQDLPTSIPQFPEGSQQRQEQMLNKLRKDVGNPIVYVADAEIVFQGGKNIKYVLTAGGVKSNIDPLSRFAAFVKKDNQEEKPLKLFTFWSALFPNTNALDLDYAIRMDLKSNVTGLLFVESEKHNSKLHFDIDLKKSEERKQYLQEHEAYVQYKKQPRVINFQAMSVITAYANFLDQFKAQVRYEDLHPKILNGTYKFYSFVRQLLYFRVNENVVDNVAPTHNKLEIEGQFSPNLKRVNVSIDSHFGQIEIEDFKFGPKTRKIVVPHPVFNLKTRLEAQLLKYNAFRSICGLNQYGITTFDNKSYPAELSHEWSVLLQHLPRTPAFGAGHPDISVLEQLKQQPESFIVLVRKSGESQKKELKIVVQSPKTQAQIVEILIKGDRQVLVNNKEVEVSQKHSRDFYEGFLQVYALPNQEVKVELRGVFHIISNGELIKITSIGSRFRDASRGLCGTFTGEPETDFLTPENCVILDSESFVQKYTLGSKSIMPGSRPKLPTHRYYPMQHGAKYSQECYEIYTQAGNYIAPQDLKHKQSHSRDSACTHLQTQYVEQGNEICFSLRPLPKCKPGCHQAGQIIKKVPVYCTPNSDATALWKAEILKGASPDFSMKHESRSIKIHVPEKCYS